MYLYLFPQAQKGHVPTSILHEELRVLPPLARQGEKLIPPVLVDWISPVKCGVLDVLSGKKALGSSLLAFSTSATRLGLLIKL